MIKTNELPANVAVVVKAIGTTRVQEGDIVLVGVKCRYLNGKYEPITPGFRLTKNIFDYCEEGELIILKREK